MEGIRVRGLVKRFGSVVALDGIDLDVDPGRIVALLGPNGAGKSTLLRILGTLVTPDSGSARVADIDVTSDRIAALQRIGLLIGDERSFYWRLSGHENLRFYGALHGMRRREAGSRATELLALMGLQEAADRRVLGYSSGMRARLLLARALLTDPPYLLLDEPTRTLDPLAAGQFREAAVGLAHQRGAGILFATHDLHEAAAIADRVAVLSAGQVVFERTAVDWDAARLEKAFLEAIDADRQRRGLERGDLVVGL
jgi:ABC-type multidrug transport system ATPase subunit